MSEYNRAVMAIASPTSSATVVRLPRSIAPQRRSHPLSSISIVVPCYNEEDVLATLRDRLKSVLSALKLPHEIVLVDDGSADKTWEMLCEFAVQDSAFKVIRLSRNFGQQTAITCGLDHARGEAVVVMDADLQDPPELLPSMIAKWQEGYDVVYGKRERREGESASKKLFAYCFYRIFARLSGIEIPSDTGDFRLMDRRAVSALMSLREKHRFIRGMVCWIGFPQTAVLYNRPQRIAGETKYPFRKSLFLAIDAIASFSYAPLRVATYLGSLVTILSFTFILGLLGFALTGRNFSGSVTLLASVLLLSGIQLSVLGVIGEYVGRIFEQGQARPLYFVDQVRGEPLAALAGANRPVTANS